MAQFPRHIIQERVNTGGTPAGMNAISISGPGRIQAPMLSPNKVQDSPYKAPFELSPQPVVNAIQNFGNTLIDVTMSVADKRARLFADEYHTIYRRHISNVLKNQEDGFLHTRELEATRQRDTVLKKINDAEQKAISSVPNHIKVYLGPLVRDETSRALDTVANHIMVEEKKAVVSASTRRLNTIAEIAYDNRRTWTIEQMEDFKNSEFSSIPFPNQLARDEASDGFWNAIVLRQSQSVIIEDEHPPEGTLHSRLSSLENLIKASEPYVGLAQSYKNTHVYERANSAVVAELNRRDAAEKTQWAVENRMATNSIAKVLNEGGTYPSLEIEQLRASGAITDLDIKKFKSWWGSNNKEEMKNAALFRKIYLDIHNDQPRDTWEPELNRGLVTGELTPEWYTMLTGEEQRVEDVNYKYYADSMKDYLESVLITPTGFFGIPDENEQELFVQAVFESTNAMKELKNLDALDKRGFDTIKDFMFNKFAIDRRINSINVFMNTAPHVPSYVRTYEDAAKVIEYYQEQFDKGEIDQPTFQMYSDRLEKLMKLFDKKAQGQEAFRTRPQ